MPSTLADALAQGRISGMSADVAEFVPSRLAVALAQGHSEGEDPSRKKRRMGGFAPQSPARYNMFDDPEGFQIDEDELEDGDMPTFAGGDDGGINHMDDLPKV